MAALYASSTERQNVHNGTAFLTERNQLRFQGSVVKILPISERVLTIFSETFDQRFQVAPFSG
ncbi:hypothetical protein [Brucella anthropi]|uniref:hypothetical protein n=1 Tax=Brucella anthropi TaxID=529 RepID=UPI001AEE054A|nr:hypothetical protein [Brucella anthropi]